MNNTAEWVERNMTYKEALEKLKYLISGESDQHPPDYDIPIQVAIEAIEKQIPKKVIYIQYVDGGLESVCPQCNRRICMHFGNGENYGFCEPYCHKCGQALDFTEV